MLKGLALTPPVLGRIAIGKVREQNGKYLPQKDDEFTLTTQVQGKEGWVLHPLNAALRQEPNQKLRNIPVRLLFDDPQLNLRASYTCFDRQSGRPICVGDGQWCKRATANGIERLPCPAPDGCPAGQDARCKPYGRLHVLVDVEPELACDGTATQDPLGSFVLRTTGFNTIRTLLARMQYFAACSGGLLSALPLALRLRGKSTAQSHRAPIYYVDLTLRDGYTMSSTLEQGQATQKQRLGSGFNQAALDACAHDGFAAGAFEESADEGALVVQEFYPEDDESRQEPVADASLADKLQAKAQHLAAEHQEAIEA